MSFIIIFYKIFNFYFPDPDNNIDFCLLSFSLKCMRQSIELSRSAMDQSDEQFTVSSTTGCDSIANAYLKVAEYCQIGYNNDRMPEVCSLYFRINKDY